MRDLCCCCSDWICYKKIEHRSSTRLSRWVAWESESVSITARSDLYTILMDSVGWSEDMKIEAEICNVKLITLVNSKGISVDRGLGQDHTDQLQHVGLVAVYSDEFEFEFELELGRIPFFASSLIQSGLVDFTLGSDTNNRSASQIIQPSSSQHQRSRPASGVPIDKNLI